MVFQNDRFLRALAHETVDATPVWLMRQAGRYLPEYRATRAKAGDFMTLCKTPELACEVTLQPLNRFNLDAAILFSDILTIPDAMGLGLYFDDTGPHFKNPLRTVDEFRQIGKVCPETDLKYVCDAVRLIKHELGNKLPLIGFSGSPWTLASYMLEGGSSRYFNILKKWLYDEPELMSQLLACLADNVSDYLKAQIEAGVDAVMIFDTWGGVLTPATYRDFSLHSMQAIVANLKSSHPKVPIILFSKGCGQHLEIMAKTGCDGLGIDWTIDIGEARKRVGDRMVLQGNMDPSMLQASPEKIREEVANILKAFGANTGHIFNLGHGITPDVNPEHVAVMVDAVHELSQPYHQS